MKLLFVVIDGLGDAGENTPLSEADTPNMDCLAKEGVTGLLYTLKGLSPGSGEAMLSLLGYDARKYYPGRGPLEALGKGYRIKDGELAIRGDLACLRGGKIVDRRAGGVKDADGEALCESLRGVGLSEGSCKVLHVKEHRVAVIIKHDQELGDRITPTDEEYEVVALDNGVELVSAAKTFEPYKPEKVKPLGGGEGFLSAKLVNEFVEKSHKILDAHPVNKKRSSQGLLPANYIILRGAGNKLYDTPSIRDVTGLRWAIIASMPVERGVADYLGMETLQVGRTGVVKKTLARKLREVKKHWDEFDAFYLYIKEPDVHGHAGSFDGKRRAIELIDEHFIKDLKGLGDDLVIVITADHATPVGLKRHSHHAVPVLVWGKGADSIEVFSEKDCENGGLGVLEETGLMEYLTK